MPKEPATLTTPRLRLEPTAAQHGAALWTAIEASLPELKRRMSWASSTSPESVAEYTARAEAGWNDGPNWDWVIFSHGQAAGTIGLNRYDELWRSCNLGYWIRTSLAGRGLATEAGRAALDFAFGTVGVNRVELVAAVDNIASQRVAEKLGFRREGMKREGTIVDGRGIDCYLYGLLASDPRPPAF